MRHDTEKTKYFNALEKSRIIKGIVNYFYSEDIVNKGLFILHGPQVVYKHNQNFSITQRACAIWKWDFVQILTFKRSFVWKNLSLDWAPLIANCLCKDVNKINQM